MSMAYEEYMRQVVLPMRAELTEAGFRELTNPMQWMNISGMHQGRRWFLLIQFVVVLLGLRALQRSIR